MSKKKIEKSALPDKPTLSHKQAYKLQAAAQDVMQAHHDIKLLNERQKIAQQKQMIADLNIKLVQQELLSLQREKRQLNEKLQDKQEISKRIGAEIAEDLGLESAQFGYDPLTLELMLKE